MEALHEGSDVDTMNSRDTISFTVLLAASIECQKSIERMLISLKYVYMITLFYMSCPTSSATVQPKIFLRVKSLEDFTDFV